LWRRGASQELNVTVGALEEQPVAQAPSSSRAPEPQASPAAERLGLSVRDLTAAEKRDLQIEGGVWVASVEGAAARAGLREDDVIVSIGNQGVRDVRGFDATIAAFPAERPVPVMIRRGDWAQYALIRP
jgi:serine protease Do